MISGVTICHRLDLVVYLQDTVTGGMITTSHVEFFCDGKPQPVIHKEPGVYAFLNLGSGEMDMTVRAAGYREQQFQAIQESGSKTVPLLWVPMTPGEGYPQRHLLHKIAGEMEGIGSICAVPYTGWQMRVQDYDEKTNILKLFNPRGCYVYPVAYGIIDQSRKNFEVFSVAEQVSKDEVRTEDRFPMDFPVNSPLGRVIAGTIKNRTYCLWLDRSMVSYLVRWTVQERVYYREWNSKENSWILLD